MTDIRQPDDWQVGDLAFCIEGGNLCAAGDIMRVTEVLPDNRVRFTDPYAVHCVDHFARILKPKEVSSLPEGAVLYHVTAALWGHVEMGSVFTNTLGTSLPSLGMYALKSLSEPKPEFKVGDWVKDARYGLIGQVTVLCSDRDRVRVKLAESYGYTSWPTSNLSLITEAEAQHHLALKDIEDARKKLADAERRLEGLDA